MERHFLMISRALNARKRKIFALFFALAASIGLSYALTPKGTDVWDDATKTLTVNSNPDDYYNDQGDIKRLVISSSVTEIGEQAFSSNYNLQEVIAYDGLQVIDQSAFVSCPNLESVILPSTLQEVKYSAFSYCENLKYVTINASSLDDYAEYAFDDTHADLKIYVPEASVATYKYFWPAYASKFQAIPSSLAVGDTLKVGDAMYSATDVYVSAGYLCFQIKASFLHTISAIEPNGAGTNIKVEFTPYAEEFYPSGSYAALTNWFYCSSDYSSGDVTAITVVSGAGTLDDPFVIDYVKPAAAANSCGGGLTWELNNGELVISYDGEGTGVMNDYDIPNDNPAPWYANREDITSVSLPEGIKTIGKDAFRDCVNLTTVTIPNSVTTIGESAFVTVEHLETVTIGTGITSIVNGAFYGNAELTTVTCSATTPPSIGGIVFGSCPNLEHIYVPAASVDAYKSAWSDYASLISAPGGGSTPTVTWNSSNISDLIVFSISESYSKEGVTLSGNADKIEAYWYGSDENNSGISFHANATGGFTFSNTLGKNFTKIEMTLNVLGGWNYANLGSEWNIDGMKAIWTGNASTVDLLKDESNFNSTPVKSIVFYFEGDGGGSATTVVTITEADFPIGGESLTKDGVTVSAGWIEGNSYDIYGDGSFSTTLGNFTKIEVCAAEVSPLGEGWSGNSECQTWTGNASSVSFSDNIMGNSQGVTLKFTIGDAAPAKPTLTLSDKVSILGMPIAGITDLGTNNYEIEPGTQFQIQAAVPEHYNFVGWSDLDTTDPNYSANPRTVTINSDLTIKPLYALEAFTITLTSNDTTMGKVTLRAGAGGGEDGDMSIANNADLEGANTSRNIAVGADGSIHVVYKSTEDQSVKYIKSIDGVTFTEPVTVANGAKECEVAVSSNGKVYVSYYKENDGGYIAYSADGTSFTSVMVENNALSIHMATDGDYVYAVNKPGTNFYYSSDGGQTYNMHSDWSEYMFSDVMVDPLTHNVVVIKDMPEVVVRYSTDHGATFTEEAQVMVQGGNDQLAIFFSTATMGDGKVYMAGADAFVAIIDYKTATCTKTDVNSTQNRSLCADPVGNVIVGVEQGENLYYQLSTNSAVSFGENVLVSNGSGANAALNYHDGTLLYLFTKDNKLYLATRTGIVPTESVVDNGDGTYAVQYGTEVTFTAKAKPGYHVESWSNAVEVNDIIVATQTLEVNSAMTIGATFAANPILTIATNDSTKGIVSLGGAGQGEPITVRWNNSDISGSGNSFTKDGVTITCGDINWDYPDFYGNGTFTTDLGNFTKIEVTADMCEMDGAGWTYDVDNMTWTGNATSVSFNGGMYIISSIVFTIEPAAPATEGIIDLGGGQYSVVPGTELTFVAQPAEEHYLVSWNDEAATSDTLKLTMTEALAVNATFAHVPYIYTLPEGVSIVEPMPAGITAKGNGVYEIVEGTEFQISADIIPEHYHFGHWADLADSVAQYAANPRTIVADKNLTVEPIFAIDTYTLTLATNDSTKGIVSVKGAGQGGQAEPITVTFTNLNNVVKVVENITLPHTFSCDYTNGNGELDLIIQESYNETGGRCDIGSPWGGNDNEVVVGQDGNNHFVTINAPFVGTSFMSGYYDGSSFGNFYYSFHITTAAAAPAAASGIVDNGDGTYTVDYGTELTFVAKPAEDFMLDSWSNGAEVTGDTLKLTMTEELSLTANFKHIPATITLPEGVNIVEPMPAGITSKGEGVYEVEYGTEFQISADSIPAHHHFDHWADLTEEDAMYAANPRTIVAGENLTIEPIFAIDTYTLTLATNDSTKGVVSLEGAGQGGLQEPSGQLIVPESWSSEVGVTITAADLPGFVASTEEAVKALPVPTEGSVFVIYNFREEVDPSGGAGNASVEAVTFENGEYVRTTSSPVDHANASYYSNQGMIFLYTTVAGQAGQGGEGGAGIVDNGDGTYTVDWGTELTFTAKAADGYHVQSWSNGAEVNDLVEATQTITMTEALDLSALFAENPIITLATNDSTMGIVTLAGAGNKLTVAGSNMDVNQNIPIRPVSSTDTRTMNQSIYPVAMLTGIAGNSISGMTYYISEPGAHVLTATYVVKLMETEQAAFSDAVAVNTESATTVYTGTIDVTGNTLDIVFDQPYAYNGGNLLVEFSISSASHQNALAKFSVFASQGGSFQQYYNFGFEEMRYYTYDFLAKTTFICGDNKGIPGVIDLGNGQYNVLPGTELTFVAQPAKDYHLVSWNGEPAVSDTMKVTVTEEISLSAFFKHDTYILTVEGAEVEIAKFADGTTDAVVLNPGTLVGVQEGDSVKLTTTATFSSADIANNLDITLHYAIEVIDGGIYDNEYALAVTDSLYDKKGFIIEPMIPDTTAAPQEEEAEVKEGIEVYGYGYCADGDMTGMLYHLKQGNPNQYKVEFEDARFDDVDWTNLDEKGPEGVIYVTVPVDVPTGDYKMTVTFRDHTEFYSLESEPISITFHVNLPETYVVALFDNVMAVVDTCECLTDIQWYWRADASQPWTMIEGATGYYYKQEGGLSGEYFIHAKMDGVDTYTCPQDDMTLYGDTKQAKVSAYPNPVVNTTTVTIENSYNYEHTLRVVNLMGNEMMTTSFEGNTTSVEMGTFPQGHYMISVDGVVVKVMKQ